MNMKKIFTAALNLHAPKKVIKGNNKPHLNKKLRKVITERSRLKNKANKSKQPIPAGIYLLKVNNRNTRTRCEICSKLTIKTPERRLASFWCLYC